MESDHKRAWFLVSAKIMDKIQRLFEERGSEALNTARKSMLEEKIECKAIKEALRYFMTEYWTDLARPTLLSLVCEAVGGDPQSTNSVAVPMILIGGAIDIHDDIIDESKTKRDRPTVFGKFGKNIALLAGDALMFKGFVLLNKSLKSFQRNKQEAVLEVIREMFFQLGDAEAFELQFRKRLDIQVEDYLRVLERKAADVEALARIGAILGDGTKEEIQSLGKYGRLLGVSLILRDDVLDSYDLYELRHRIQKEHLPLPLLYASRDPKSKENVISILSKKKMNRKDLQALSQIAKKDRQSLQLLNRTVGKASACVLGLKGTEILQALPGLIANELQAR